MSANQVLQGNQPQGPQPRTEKLLERYINKVAGLEYQNEALQDIVEQKEEEIARLKAQLEEPDENVVPEEA